MALPTCVKCGGHVFEGKEVEPMGLKFKVIFIQCTSCGGVVGVKDFQNVPTLIHTLAKKLKISL